MQIQPHQRNDIIILLIIIHIIISFTLQDLVLLALEWKEPQNNWRRLTTAGDQHDSNTFNKNKNNTNRHVHIYTSILKILQNILVFYILKTLSEINYLTCRTAPLHDCPQHETTLTLH